MQRADVLDQAKKAVAERNTNYGKPEDNFARIARRWTVHLRNAYGADVTVTPASVALMLADVKSARLENDPKHADSWVDLAGYSACGAEVAGAGEPDKVEPKFKVGDRVWHPSGEAIVQKVSGHVMWVQWQLPNGTRRDDSWPYYTGEFEKVEPPKFKVGDRVYFVPVGSPGAINIEGRVTHVTKDQVWAEWAHPGENHVRTYPMPVERVFRALTTREVADAAARYRDQKGGQPKTHGPPGAC